MIHKLSDVQTNNIGEETFVWQYTVILKDAVIGGNCNINCHVFIENDVIMGDNVTVKAGVYLWDGIRIENDVFIGPNVTFTNDKRPRSKQYPYQYQQTILKKKSSIGAGSVIIGGSEIGEFAMVGAGSVVTKNVPSRALVVGNPAKVIGWLNEDGSKMDKSEDYWIATDGSKWKVINEVLQKV